MLSVTDLNHFCYARDFTDMRCKYHRVLSIIREQFHCEPEDSNFFIVMSCNRRIVRMFPFDSRFYSLFGKNYVLGCYLLIVLQIKGLNLIRLQHIIESKIGLLSRFSYSVTPINDSEGVLEDQKDRYLQYLAEQNQNLRLGRRLCNLFWKISWLSRKNMKKK